jgi:uncharacterized membrane protein YhaH (DUF805 family)
MYDVLFSFEGRLNRARFWKYSVALFLLGIFYYFLIAGILTESNYDVVSFLFIVGAFVSLYISLALQVKRWHDIDKSGWWSIISFIPYLGIVAFVVVGFFKGTTGTNRFGKDPLEFGNDVNIEQKDKNEYIK